MVKTEPVLGAVIKSRRQQNGHIETDTVPSGNDLIDRLTRLPYNLGQIVLSPSPILHRLPENLTGVLWPRFK